MRTDQGARRIADVDATIQRELAEVGSGLLSLTAAWNGDAAASFGSVWQQLNVDAAALHGALVEMAACLPADADRGVRR